MVGVIFIVVEVERQRGVFDPSGFVYEIHLDAPFLIHLNKLRKLCDTATAATRKALDAWHTASEQAAGALVALEKDPLESFKIPKLVEMRKVFAAPAAKV